MRVTGGRHRGRPLAAPPGRDVRPTADRVRESLFNRLLHGGGVLGDGNRLAGATVLDAFAGTGALAIEAISRGAASATLFDTDRTALATIRSNLEGLGDGSRMRVFMADATSPPPAVAPVDLVFLDPPYRSGLTGPALAALHQAGWIGPGTLCVVEHHHREPLAPPDGFEVLDSRRYGNSAVTLCQLDNRR